MRWATSAASPSDLWAAEVGFREGGVRRLDGHAEFMGHSRSDEIRAGGIRIVDSATSVNKAPAATSHPFWDFTATLWEFTAR